MAQIWNGYKYVEEDSPEGKKVKARDAKQEVVSKVDRGIATIQENEAGRERDKGYASLRHIANQLVPGSYPGHNPGGWAENGATFKTPYQSRVLTTAKPAPAAVTKPAASTPAPTGQAAAPAPKRRNLKTTAAQSRRDVPFFGKGVTDNRIAEQAKLNETPSGPPPDQPPVMEESRPSGKDADQREPAPAPAAVPARNTDQRLTDEQLQKNFESQSPADQRKYMELMRSGVMGGLQGKLDGDEPEAVDNPKEELREQSPLVVKDGKWQRREPAPAPATTAAPAPVADPKAGAKGQASPGNAPVAATPAVLQAKPPTQGGNLLAVATNDRYQPSAFTSPDAVSANPPAYVAPATTAAPAASPSAAPAPTPAPAPAAVPATASAVLGQGGAKLDAPPPTAKAASAIANPAPPPKTPQQIAMEMQAAEPIKYREDTPSQNVEGKPYPNLPLPAMPDNVSQEQLIKDAEAKATAGGAYEKPNGGLLKRIGMSLLKFAQGTAEGMVKSDKPFGFAALNESVGGGVQRANDYQTNEEDRAAWRQRRDEELQKTLPAASARQADVDKRRADEERQYELEHRQDLEAQARAENARRNQERLQQIAATQKYNNDRLQLLQQQTDYKAQALNSKGNFAGAKQVTAQVDHIKAQIDDLTKQRDLVVEQIKTTDPANPARGSLDQRVSELNAQIWKMHEQWGQLLQQASTDQSAGTLSPEAWAKIQSDPVGMQLIQQYEAAPTGSAEEARLGGLLQQYMQKLQTGGQ